MQAWLFLAVALSACASAGPLIDDGLPAPDLDIETPVRGTMTEHNQVTVAGVAFSDVADIESIEVNGRSAQRGDNGQFSITITLPPGLHLLETVVTDRAGRQTRDTRAVMTGARSPLGDAIDDAVITELSPDAISALGSATGHALAAADLGALASVANPILTIGGDCFGARVDIKSLDADDIDLVLAPQRGSVRVEATLDHVSLALGGEFAAACASAGTVVAATADRLTFSGDLHLAVEDGTVVADFDSSRADIDNFAVVLTGVAVVDQNLINADLAVSFAVGKILEAQLGPAIEAHLSEMAHRELRLQAGASFVVASAQPTSLEVSDDGIRLAVSARVSTTGTEIPRFVRTPAQQPSSSTRRTSAGLRLSISDDSINQALAAGWATGLGQGTFKKSDLGLGSVGRALETVIIEAPLPPMVRFDDDGSTATVSIGDLKVVLIGPDRQLAELALSGTVDLAIAEATRATTAQTTLVIDSELSSLTIDIVDLATATSDGLTAEVIEAAANVAATAFARSAGELIGFVPLPSLMGTGVLSPTLTPDRDYLRIEGNISPLL